jgi:hypothetical protein
MNVDRTGVLHSFYSMPHLSHPYRPEPVLKSVSAGQDTWGGWGSNPRPADYEKYGLLQPVR